jgi:ABC-type transport system involved in cytochrome c biogenesis permease subunit
MGHASIIFSWVAYLLYGAAFAFSLYHLFSRRPVMNRLSLACAASALACQTAAIALRGLAVGRVPVVGAYESLSLAAWSIVVVYLMLELIAKVKAIGLYVMPVVLLLLTVGLLQHETVAGALAPALRSDIVVLHVIVVFTAIGCLYLAGGAALIYLIEDALLKRRRPDGVLGRLPSLATLEKLVYHATLVGLPFLTMGICAGVIRAETFEVARWWVDPMVLLSLAGWVVYVVLLWGRMRAGWVGTRLAWLAVVGLVVLLVIRLAAVPYLSGFHTYGG